MKLLLTSCGLATEGIQNKFMSFFDKDIQEVRAVFIPTAANSADAIEVLPKCMNDLLKCGITKENINVYDLHIPMIIDDLMQYDVMYICGGDPQYLLERINENKFNETLKVFIQNNKVVVGVSAGSMIFANNLSKNLGLLPCHLDVHCSEDDCEAIGQVTLFADKHIRLGNEQAIVLENNNEVVIII